MMMKVTNTTHGMLAANRAEKNAVQLRRILKDGTPGAVKNYQRMGKEKTAQDVINRLEGLNPGSRWIEA